MTPRIKRAPSAAASRAVMAAAIVLFLAPAGGAAAAQALYHVLQKGETVYALSRAYSVPAAAILSANGITDPSRLKEGMRLLIPSLHTVAKGETLFGIAKSYGLAVDALRAANRLGARDLIKPGDLIVIPQGGAGREAVSPAAAVAVRPAAPAAAAPAPGGAGVPLSSPSGALSPPALRTSSRAMDRTVSWPCPGDAVYLEGKLFGVMIRPRPGEAVKAVASGTVVSAGPYRGFGQVAFIQSRSGHIYVYGGNEALSVRVGESVRPGQALGKVGVDPKEGLPLAYFFVFRNGEALDPASAPRD